jgi:hypothetical protein
MPDLPPTLPAYLWDLRAQLEAQLRCLTKIQRWVDEFSELSPRQQPGRSKEIIENLREILTTGDLVRRVTGEAIASVEGLEPPKPDRRKKPRL